MASVLPHWNRRVAQLLLKGHAERKQYDRFHRPSTMRQMGGDAFKAPAIAIEKTKFVAAAQLCVFMCLPPLSNRSENKQFLVDARG